MRGRRFWTIVLPLGLIAAPALAGQNKSDAGNDCFDVAAPMADATPCYEPGRHAHLHHTHHGRNAPKMASEKVGVSSDDRRGSLANSLRKE